MDHKDRTFLVEERIGDASIAKLKEVRIQRVGRDQVKVGVVLEKVGGTRQFIREGALCHPSKAAQTVRNLCGEVYGPAVPEDPDENLWGELPL